MEFLSPEQAEQLPPGAGEVIEKGDTEIHYNEVFSRDVAGEFSLSGPADPASPDDRGFRLLHRIAAATDRRPDAVEQEFRRKRRYVEYLADEGVDGFDELFDLLADLRTDEAATVERLRRTAVADGGQSDDRGTADEY